MALAIVCQVAGDTKTDTSRKPLPLGDELAAALLDWKGKTPYNREENWVFASPARRGEQPLWPSSAMSKHIGPPLSAPVVQSMSAGTFSYTRLQSSEGQR